MAGDYKYTGNASKCNPSGQTVEKGGKGGRMKNVGYGEEDSKRTGSAKPPTKPVSNKCNTPNGQVVK